LYQDASGSLPVANTFLETNDQARKQEVNMFRVGILLATLALVCASAAGPSKAQNALETKDLFDPGEIVPPDEIPSDTSQIPQLDSNNRLMIINRNTGRVIYDDGRNDLFCASRVYIAGYTTSGRPIYRRNMRCR
jgi:hypothetical protein